MAWSTPDRPDRIEAVAYTRNYSADSVFDELKETGGRDFSATEEHIEYYGLDNWKVYKITIIIEPN
jgi:hypothetical protein